MNGVLELSEAGNLVIDLSFLEDLTHLKVLRLEDNGIEQLILPSTWHQLEELWLDRNRLNELKSLARSPQLWVVFAVGNQLGEFSLTASRKAYQHINLTENPLQTLEIFAGIPELIPSVEQMRQAGASVTVLQRIRLLSLGDGQPAVEVFGDSGRYAVRCSAGFTDWEVGGELQIEQSNFPGAM
ncbi:MAG: hypothetical protein M2R45_01727 [Verrucomicrobia subdivision 3 bacterium]|nr:hypothetical protein [Limisphaerales bacterium]MCS1413464.1 hypothetical protein [Limisphaerales bacterium]